MESHFNKDLTVKSDLELSNLVAGDVPTDILFPDELNRYLREQIQYVRHENVMLQRNFSEQERQLEETQEKLKVLLKEQQQAGLKNSPKNEYVTASQVSNSKFVELSKKLREKTSEVECLKNRCSKLEAELSECHFSETDDGQEETVKKTPSDDDQTKKLQDKLSMTTYKLLEAKNSNTQLKNELKSMKKCLQQEIGENYESLVSNSNWRGRAQTICDLTQKNTELKEKLKNIQDKTAGNATNVEAIAKAESKIHTLTQENEQIKNASEDLLKKFSTLKTKHRTMETDFSIMKSKYGLLSEQTERDKEIMNTLTWQLSTLKETQNDAHRQKDKQIKKLKSEVDNLTGEINKYKCQIDNMNNTIIEKSKQIAVLKAVEGGPKLNNEIIPTKKDNQLGRMEAERLRLLELLEMENRRLQAERDKHGETQNQLRFERHRAAKLESTVARMNLEQNSTKVASYSNLIANRSQDTIGRLQDDLVLAEETIKALKTRIDLEKQERKQDYIEFSRILQNDDRKKK
ncbi:coiled-coil domain-containing protein 13 isoform X2 [Aethina tumida]|uniref:coiled-coil domain-containing protein 13 isoform X2 n=1 Tax=Aethina tumida TaxID=116153 RepID=UPI00096B1637|nr:coiled-coil domain-containing protein 13 isoform X2 [Aethina tumida]